MTPSRIAKNRQKLSKTERLREGFKVWTSFYRENPHRFAEDYLGLNLKLFQKILLYLMFHVSSFMYFAARGQGKSYLIAIFCVIRCILFPQTMIVVASGTKGQAKLIITQKIEKELMQYPNIAREIKMIKSNNNQVMVLFHNGSTIEAVTSNDNARGYRAQILIADEFRMIKEDIYERVLRQFLNVQRQPPYLKNPKYAHLTEENKEIFISSAWFKNHWCYEKFVAFRNSMIRGRDYFACALPYQLSVHHGLLSQKRVESMKTEDNFDPIAWQMEMECMFFGESEKAFFKFDDLQKNRTIVKPFIPYTSYEYLQLKNQKKKPKHKNPPKIDGEIRLIGVDVALMGGNDNDNTIFTFMRLIPNGDSYIKQVPYIESMTGQHTETQAIRLKQLFEDFEADYVAMDTNGNGLSLYDDCAKVLYDEERDVEYPAWCAMNNEEMKSRALSKNALPVIYSIKVVKQEVNHEMAMDLRNDFEKGRIKLLINELDARDYLDEKHDYNNRTVEDQVRLLNPYLQTTILINEMVNLEYEMRNGFVKLHEIGSNRKDRYSSLSYCNYYAGQLEEENQKANEEYDFAFFFN